MLYMGLPKSVKKSRSILYKFKKRLMKKEEVNINGGQLNKVNKSRITNSIFSILVSVIKLLKNVQILF